MTIPDTHLQLNSASVIEHMHAAGRGCPSTAEASGLSRNVFTRALMDPWFGCEIGPAERLASVLGVTIEDLTVETLYVLIGPHGLVEVGSYLIGADSPKAAKAVVKYLEAAGYDVSAWNYVPLTKPQIHEILAMQIADPLIASAAICRNPSSSALAALVMLDAAMSSDLAGDQLLAAVSIDCAFGLSKILTRQAQRLDYLLSTRPADEATIRVDEAVRRIGALHMLLLDTLVKPVSEAATTEAPRGA